ncbi:MAG: hypothetical protein MOP51_2403 [Citricoccus sp.]|jgi:hypothetical protein|nr:hypothetical protein [Citricoccus sp. WCRC_4]
MSGNLVARSVHDLSAAAWFGGSLMGAVGLNGATAQAKDPTERTRLSSLGWKRWAPVQTAAFAAHLGTWAPILWENKGRYVAQQGVMRWTWVKAGVTVAGAAVTLYSGMLGRKVDELSQQGAQGATEPSPTASPELQEAQERLRLLQWTIPAFAGAVIVLGAHHGELQRARNLRPKRLDNVKAVARLVPMKGPAGVVKSLLTS